MSRRPDPERERELELERARDVERERERAARTTIFAGPSVRPALILLAAVAGLSGSVGYGLGRWHSDVSGGAGGESPSASLARTLHRAADYAPAPASADAAARAAALVEEARSRQSRGDWGAAFTAAKDALLLDPANSAALTIAREAQVRLRSVEAAPPRSPAPIPPGEEDRRLAIKHWNNGIIFFQRGEYAKARDEWLLCKQFDPNNPDCVTGLARLDSSYGGGL